MRKITMCFITTVIMISLWSCGYAQFFPQEGVWYCEDLEMHLDFMDKSNCSFVYKGEKIACSLGYDKGSSLLTVGCQDEDNQSFALGELVFAAEFVSLTTDKLVLLEEETQTEFCFLRIRGMP